MENQDPTARTQGNGKQLPLSHWEFFDTLRYTKQELFAKGDVSSTSFAVL